MFDWIVSWFEKPQKMITLWLRISEYTYTKTIPVRKVPYLFDRLSIDGLIVKRDRPIFNLEDTYLCTIDRDLSSTPKSEDLLKAGWSIR